MPQFEFSTYYSQIFWLVLVFSFLYILVCNFVSPTAERIFTNRSNVVENEISEASEMTLIAGELMTLHDVELKNIINLTENIRKEAKISLDTSLALKIVNLEKDLRIKEEKNLNEIAKTTEVFLYKEMEASMNLALFIIEKITNRKANEELLKSCYEKVR